MSRTLVNIFILFYCRADWGYESIVDKPPRLLSPYSLTLIHCPQATKYPEHSDQDGTLWGWGTGHREGKVQMVLSHTKIFKSLTTHRLAHFFSICSMTWHQDSNPYIDGRTGVLDSRYAKNKTRASRQNRKLVEVEDRAFWTGTWFLSGSLPAWHLCLGYTYPLATGPQLILKKCFHADKSFHWVFNMQTARPPHFPTQNWRWKPKTLLPWMIAMSVSWGMSKNCEYHLRLL